MKPAEPRYILIPIVIAIALLFALFTMVDRGQTRLREATQTVTASEQRQAMISELMQRIFDAEAAQRGFLLTQESKYLQFLDPAIADIDPLLDRLGDSYSAEGRTSVYPQLRRLRTLTGMKVGDIRSSLRLYGEQGLPAALGLMRTDYGKKATDEIRDGVAALRQSDQQYVLAATARWQDDLRFLRIAIIATIMLSIALLLLTGALFVRDARHRAEHARELLQRNESLDAQVQQRTQMLSELTSHLQQVTENERRSLARELHDELGGLLVATKMDLVWLRRKLPDTDAQIALRWERILHAIEQGLAFKRRVIETLRPTLLDNLGLVAALHWLVTDACQAAALQFEENYPETLPELSGDANIALFRFVQECLSNVIQHAHASLVRITVDYDTGWLRLTVSDNGVGVAHERLGSPGTHGLAGLRQRILALGGELQIRRTHAEGGTTVAVRLPLARARAATTEDAVPA